MTARTMSQVRTMLHVCCTYTSAKNCQLDQHPLQWRLKARARYILHLDAID